MRTNEEGTEKRRWKCEGMDRENGVEWRFEFEKRRMEMRVAVEYELWRGWSKSNTFEGLAELCRLAYSLNEIGGMSELRNHGMKQRTINDCIAYYMVACTMQTTVSY